MRLLWTTICVNKLDNLEEMDGFLDTYSLSRLSHEEIKNMSIPVTSKEIESVIKKLQTKSRSRELHW